MHHFVFPVNNFFQSFFRKPFDPPFPACLAGFVEAALPQRGVGLCLKAPALSNTFLRFFPTFFRYGLQYTGFVGFIKPLTSV
jgi:hypothetical protein